MISISGKSHGRKCAITDSSGICSPRSPIATKRGRPSGTFTRAKRSSPDSGSRTTTPRLSDSPEMYGNGWPGPTASGVSTGKIWWANTRFELRALGLGRVLDGADDDPLGGQRGAEVLPPEPRLLGRELDRALADLGRASAAACGRRATEPATRTRPGRAAPATRTMKNSSRLLEKMPQNLMRSSSGSFGSAARSSTRAFRSSQESSRFRSGGRRVGLQALGITGP